MHKEKNAQKYVHLLLQHTMVDKINVWLFCVCVCYEKKRWCKCTGSDRTRTRTQPTKTKRKNNYRINDDSNPLCSWNRNIKYFRNLLGDLALSNTVNNTIIIYWIREIRPKKNCREEWSMHTKKTNSIKQPRIFTSEENGCIHIKRIIDY